MKNHYLYIVSDSRIFLSTCNKFNDWSITVCDCDRNFLCDDTLITHNGTTNSNHGNVIWNRCVWRDRNSINWNCFVPERMSTVFHSAIDTLINLDPHGTCDHKWNNAFYVYWKICFFTSCYSQISNAKQGDWNTFSFSGTVRNLNWVFYFC